MNALEKIKIDFLRAKIEKTKKEANDKGFFSIFNAKFMDKLYENPNYKQMKTIYDIIESWEGKYKIPYNLGVSLDAFAEDPRTVVCIHRTRLDIDYDTNGLPIGKDLNTIMENGLINYGDANAVGGSAFSTNPPDLIKTMTPFKGLSGYINLIGPYHENNTIIMCGFPSYLVSNDGYITNDYDKIYNLDGQHAQIKPEYMMGAIIKDGNGLFKFYTKDEIIKANKQQIKNPSI